jgi:protein phosphatase
MIGDASHQPWRGAASRSLNVGSFQSSSSSVTVEIAAASVCGELRSHNTDHYLAIRLGRMQETLLTSLMAADLPPRFEEFGYAMLVADGLGEQAAGTMASRVALSALAHLAIRYGRWIVRVGPDTFADINEQGQFYYRQANDAVFQASRASSQLADMATSLTALYVAQDNLIFAHIGHSRAYLFREGMLTQLTTDHTSEQQRRATGEPIPLERARRDMGHLVTRTLGGWPTGGDKQMQMEHLKLASGDRLLLCTNGLTDVVSGGQLADQFALQRGPSEDCQRFIELVRAGGTPDDATVMVADYRIRQDRADRTT